MKIFLMRHGDRQLRESKKLPLGTPLRRRDSATRAWRKGPTPADKSAEFTPLSKTGKQQVRKLAKKLKVRPGGYFASNSTHAWQTAKNLAGMIPPAMIRRVVLLWALTPGGEVPGTASLRHRKLTFRHMIKELESHGLRPSELKRIDVLVFVGHNPRLGQLFANLTRKATKVKRRVFSESKWPKAGGVLLKGGYSDFRDGRALVLRRIP